MNKIIIRMFAVHVVFLICMAGIAAAETGNITIEDVLSTAYIDNTGTGAPTGYSLHYLVFDYTNYNYLSGFHVIDQDLGAYGHSLTFVNMYESTQFSCDGANTCNGWFWYDKTAAKIYYEFIGAQTITANPVHLIFANPAVVANVAFTSRPGTGFSSIHPTGIGMSSGATLMNGNYGNVVVKAITTDTYNVTYPSGMAFVVNVTKGKSVADTWEILKGSNVAYTKETTLNKNDFQYNSLIYEGIKVNVSLVGGGHTTKTINLTGTNYTVEEEEEEIVVGANGYGIQAYPSTRYQSQTVNISWKRTSAPCFGCIDYILYARPKGKGTTYQGALWVTERDGYYTFLMMDNPPNEGSIQLTAEQPYTYYVMFASCLAGACFGEYIKASDSFEVLNTYPSYLLVNATVPVGKLFPVGYSVGFVSIYSPQIRVYYLENAAWELYDTLVMSTTYNLNQVYYTNTRLRDVGTYMMKLCDPGTDLCSQGVQVKAIYQGVNTTYGITQALLTMDSDLYFFDETAQVKAIVDDTNFSRSVYLEVLNENGQTTYVSEVPGQWWDYSVQLSPEYYFAGNNTLRMISKDATNTIVVKTVNFSITETDSAGNGMKTDKKSYCMKDKGIITVTTLDGNLSLVVSDPRKRDETYHIDNSVKLSYVFAYNGTYYLRLWEGTNIIRMVVVQVNDCTADEAAAAAAGGAGSIVGVTSFIGSSTFLSILILVTFMVIGFSMGGAIGGVATIGAAIPILSFGGLIPPWIAFLEGGIVFICIAILCATHITKSG